MAAGLAPHAAISIALAFRFAWQVLWQRFALFAAILSTCFVAWVILEIVVIGGQQFGPVLWALAHVAFLIFFAGLAAGLVRVCLDLHDGHSPTIATAFAHLALGPKFLAGQLAYLLMGAAGLVLLVFPGLYLLARLALFGFRLVDGEPGLIASFQQSAALTSGAVPPLVGLAVLLFLLNLLGICLLGVGLFATVPLSALVLADVYRQLCP